MRAGHPQMSLMDSLSVDRKALPANALETRLGIVKQLLQAWETMDGAKVVDK
jgi:hypothetical protein